jgi:hypothetical protein
MMTVTRGDLEVLFYTHHNGDREEQRVQISVGGGRSDTWLSLQEFCELMAECRKEISVRHWQPRADLAQIGEMESANTV